MAEHPDVTLRQLRYFTVLGAELSYRRAAERLYISQPSLSTAIQQLERQFGVQLFTRNTREVSLTAIGAKWLPCVQQALAGVDLVVNDLSRWSRSAAQSVRVGYLIGTGADLLFVLLRQFEEAHPDVTVETVEYDFARPDAGLRDGSTDVALIRPPVELPRHLMLVIEREHWVACLPRDHRLADREDVDIAELLDEPIVCAPDSAGVWRDYWLAMDARAGRAPRIAGVAATYETETTLIARGRGISFTTSAIARLYDRPGISYVPIRDRPPSLLALAWNPDGLTAEADALIRFAGRSLPSGESTRRLPQR